MKNIFKEIKKLKIENAELKIENNELKKLNNEGVLKLEEYYNARLETHKKFLKNEYNTKIERKKQIEKICKNYENKINKNLTSFMDFDISEDIENYLKLLNFLKEN